MLVLYGFVALCSLTEILAGYQACRDVKTLKNFDPSKYMGTWYQNGVVNWKPSMKCVKYTWFSAPSGKIQIDSTSFYIEGNRISNTSGEIVIPNASEPGRVKLTVARNPINRLILETDYTSYSVEYDCPLPKPLVRILTRELNPPQSVIDEGMRVIREHGFTTENYITTDQSCWKSEVRSNEKLTTTKAPETKESPENPESKSQRLITENEEEKVVEQREPGKPLSPNQILNIEIDITLRKIPRATPEK